MRNFLKELADAKIEIHFMDTPISTSNEALRKMGVSMSLAFAEFERDRTKERVKFTMADLKTKGRYLGNLPFDKKILAVQEGKKLVKYLVPNEYNLETLRMIHFWRNQQPDPISYERIADALVKLGRVNNHGVIKWTTSDVYSLAKRYLN
jgi:DNA invertase Pin-like site-specific DNA recombinase